MKNLDQKFKFLIKQAQKGVIFSNSQNDNILSGTKIYFYNVQWLLIVLFAIKNAWYKFVSKSVAAAVFGTFRTTRVN